MGIKSLPGINKRTEERRSVTEIIKVLSDISGDLNSLDQEKTGHIERLKDEQKHIESEIKEASLEQKMGNKIAENIRNLIDVDDIYNEINEEEKTDGVE